MGRSAKPRTERNSGLRNRLSSEGHKEACVPRGTWQDKMVLMAGLFGRHPHTGDDRTYVPTRPLVLVGSG